MFPPSKSHPETANSGKSSGGSSSSSDGPILSMDLFPQFEDVGLDSSPCALRSEDVMIRLQSSELVEDILLPDIAMTAYNEIVPLDEEMSVSSGDWVKTLGALSCDYSMNRPQNAELAKGILLPDAAVTAYAALKAEQPSHVTNGSLSSLPKQQQQEEMRQLTSDIVPLDEEMGVSSAYWVEGFDAGSSDLVDASPSLLSDDQQSSPGSVDGAASQCSTSPPGLDSLTLTYSYHTTPVPVTSSIHINHWIKDFKGEPYSGLMHPSSFRNNARMEEPHPPLNSRTAPKPPSKKSKPARKQPTRKQRRKPRLLDTTRAVTKTDNDVLFGRGGGTNAHPGNIKFREQAREYLPWYVKSTKEEKEKIADLLVESVRGRGHRFLERGKDGLWHEVIRGEHTKACATFRDLKYGMTKKK